MNIGLEQADLGKMLLTADAARLIAEAGFPIEPGDVARLANQQVFRGAAKASNIWQIPEESVYDYISYLRAQQKVRRRLTMLGSSIAAALIFLCTVTSGFKDFLDGLSDYRGLLKPSQEVTATSTLRPSVMEEIRTSTRTPTISLTESASKTPTQQLLSLTTPTSEPEVRAILATPFIPQPPDFSHLLSMHPDIAQRLSSTIWPRPVLEDDGAYQEFEGGIMIFRGRASRETSIYVLPCTEEVGPSSVGSPPCTQGPYATYPNDWRQDIDTRFPVELNPPARFNQPANGFGLVWYQNPSVRQTLQWGTMCELSLYLYVQTFFEGMLIYLSETYRHHFPYADLGCDVRDGYRHEGKTYAIFYTPSGSQSGTWRYLPDLVDAD